MLPDLKPRPAELCEDFSSDDLPHSRMQAMFGYWTERRNGGTMPPVSAIDPLDMPRNSLAYLAVLEIVDNPRRFRIRLQGTQMVEAIGRDLTGQYLDELAGMDQPIARTQWCCTHRRPYLVEAPFSWSPQHYKTYSSLNLPFGDAETGVRRIVSVFVFY
ncbi:MAG: PAS domain-containing protein [Alphaproteobacteria bacterium]|jgi:hypothetical protein|nr:PAS domain-containing protein [Alphaproteobacteria bacterium]